MRNFSTIMVGLMIALSSVSTRSQTVNGRNYTIYPVNGRSYSTFGVNGRSYAASQTPGFVQHSDESLTWDWDSASYNIKTYTVVLNQPSQVGDIVIYNFATADSDLPSGLTISDGTSNSYTDVNSVSNSTLGITLVQFCGVQTNSAQVFTITGSTNLGSAWVKASATEFHNASCTVDQTWTHAATTASTTVTAGTATKAPSKTNDLIHTFFWTDLDDAGTQDTFTAGSQTGISWSLVPGSGQNWDQTGQQWGVYTITTAINPTMTQSVSDTYAAVAVALEPSSSGSAPPSTLWVYDTQHGAIGGDGGNTPDNATSPLKWQFPTVGNLGILLYTAPTGTSIDSISSSVSGETWQKAVQYDNGADSGIAAIWYACNISPSQSRILTATLAGNSPNGSTFNLLDVGGAVASSSCLDTGSSASGTLTGSQTTTGASIVYSIGGFSATDELVVSVLSVEDAGVKDSAQTEGVNFLQGTFANTVSGSNQCDSDVGPPNWVDECNGFFISVISSTSSFEITAPEISGTTGGAFGDYLAGWAAFQ